MPYAHPITEMMKSKLPTAPLLSSYKGDELVKIMLIEDTNADVLLTKKSLEETGISFTLECIKRGDDALAQLQSKTLFQTHLQPDLIMLDLEIPGMDGFEVLAELGRMPASIRAIPIVILTAHRNFEYIRTTYPLCVLLYSNKPCNPDELKKVLLCIRKCNADIARAMH